MLKQRTHAIFAAAVAMFLALPALVAQAGPGSGTHGGKMALCFFDEKGNPDLTARTKYFDFFPGSGWKFKNDEAREMARGRFTATLLELAKLKDAPVLKNVWAKKKTAVEALQAMHDELRRVPKFYRLLALAQGHLPKIADVNDNSNPFVTFSNQSLTLIDDFNDTTDPGDNCVATQAAARFRDKITYDALIWSAADETQRAALQFHEELYFLGARVFGQQTSQLTQEVIQYLAQGNLGDGRRVGIGGRPADITAAETWEKNPLVQSAREDDLSAMLSDRWDATGMPTPDDTASGEDSFGYYPTLSQLTNLRDSIQSDVIALHGALGNLKAYCDGARSTALERAFGLGSSGKKGGNQADIRAAHTSLRGVVARIASVGKASQTIEALINAQNGRFASARYSKAKGSEDPEVLISTLADLLADTGSHVNSDMIAPVKDPQRFFHGRLNDAYCHARGAAEEAIEQISQGLDSINFMWDPTLSPVAQPLIAQ